MIVICPKSRSDTEKRPAAKPAFHQVEKSAVRQSSVVGR
jgi:hypothetical protein